MKLDAGKPILLDTSIVVHLVRGQATGQALDDAYGLCGSRDRPLISSITEGEVAALALGWRWGEAKLATLTKLLDKLVSVSAGEPDVIERYAVLYNLATKGGHPRGENDLWIAATAMAAGAILLTMDKDFDWMTPDHVTVLRADDAL